MLLSLFQLSTSPRSWHLMKVLPLVLSGPTFQTGSSAYIAWGLFVAALNVAQTSNCAAPDLPIS